MGSFNSRSLDPGPVTAGELALKAPILNPIFSGQVKLNSIPGGGFTVQTESGSSRFNSITFDNAGGVSPLYVTDRGRGTSTAPGDLLAGDMMHGTVIRGYGDGVKRTPIYRRSMAFGNFSGGSFVATEEFYKTSLASPGSFALVYVLDQNNIFDFKFPIRPPQYTLATLPSVVTFSGCYITVTNATGGPKLCYSNGVNWLIVNTTIPVS